MKTNNPIKIYSDGHQIDRSQNEGSINDLSIAFWNDLTPKERERKYGVRAEGFSLCSSLSDSDYYLLPMIWGFYVNNNLINLAIDDVEKAKKANKPVIIFNQGDNPAKLPFSGIILLETSGYLSRNNSNNNTVLGLPAFIRDYLAVYCDNQIAYPSINPKPLVGFCGQASQKFYEFIFREIRRIARKISFSIGIEPWEPPPFETVKFRGDVLNILKKSKLIDTNFILRPKYRAGYQAPKKDPLHPTRLEFVQNIFDTNYTVCMRGGGNWSLRFYETLCLGRIPVFVNTDCLLPFCDRINFKDYFVWVEKSDISTIDRKIAEFQNRFTSDEFHEAQRKCRELWETYFSRDGFYRNLSLFLREHYHGSAVN